ncbi:MULTISPECIES: hypothetical protein [unclassified Chryseobacterium]|uniref:hypothetical protein n=1 Tax=unclassified Chryseobacterium TaxID=2593645 RepID=UPI001AE5E355|nr:MULTISPECIES: hypothetical protein [unclassified Chryseobacterium]MBP1165611.1 hypothetical protein [Chryseobacterium sp. PvR013]MDR4894454.1 hypothetical protein [Chryseobacterium sp. CFS7]
MKKDFTNKEKNKLPLTFKHIDIVKSKNREKKHFSIVIPCKKYDTDAYAKLNPYKFLTRLI